jgi:hypothetical protein
MLQGMHHSVAVSRKKHECIEWLGQKRNGLKKRRDNYHSDKADKRRQEGGGILDLVAAEVLK